MGPDKQRLTKAFIRLDHLEHNVRLLQEEVGTRRLWPVIKANAYGHDAEIIARRLVGFGYNRLAVADVAEAIALIEAGVEATFIILSATLPEHSEALVAHGCEPVVCTPEMAEALAHEAYRVGKRVAIHLKVDTGMGRIGVPSEGVTAFLEQCRAHPSLEVRGLMSHLARADEADKAFSERQIQLFKGVIDATRGYGIVFKHMANSAGLLDLPTSHFDAVRPGIAIYGLRPSWEIANPKVKDLKPVLEWKTRITFLKEVPAGTGLSYGHDFTTERRSLIATVPAGYADGLNRRLSNNLDVLVHGVRCPQVGRITMDMSLIDVTALEGPVRLGDEVVLIGGQGEEAITADEMAAKLDTINYEIVSAVARRVPRVAANNC